jgi:hypothetical protein
MSTFNTREEQLAVKQHEERLKKAQLLSMIEEGNEDVAKQAANELLKD